MANSRAMADEPSSPSLSTSVAMPLIPELSSHPSSSESYGWRQPNSRLLDPTDPQKTTLLQFCKTMSGDHSVNRSIYDPYPYMMIDKRKRGSLLNDQGHRKPPKVSLRINETVTYVLYDPDQDEICMVHSVECHQLLKYLRRPRVGMMFEISLELLDSTSIQWMMEDQKIIVGIHRRLRSIYCNMSKMASDTLRHPETGSSMTDLIESSAELHIQLTQGIREPNISQEQSCGISSCFPNFRGDSSDYQTRPSTTPTMETSLLFEQLALKNSPISRRFIAAAFCGARPKFTAVQLVTLSIKAAGRPLTRSEAFEWLRDTFPYFKRHKRVLEKILVGPYGAQNTGYDIPLKTSHTPTGEIMRDVSGYAVYPIFEDLIPPNIDPFWRHLTCLHPQRSSPKLTLCEMLVQALPVELVVSITKLLLPTNDIFVIGIDEDERPALHRPFPWDPKPLRISHSVESLGEKVDLNEFLEDAKHLVVGNLFLELFFAQNTFFIGGYHRASPSDSREMLKSLGEDICFHIRKVVVLIELRRDWKWMEETVEMLQCLGQTRPISLKLRIRTGFSYLPQQFKRSVVYEFMSKFRNINNLEFELEEQPVSERNIQWLETLSDLQVHMTSYRAGGGLVCSVAQPPVQAFDIIHWPSTRRGDYKKASKAYFESLGQVRNPGDLKEECDMIAEYMKDVWDKENGTPNVPLSRKRKAPAAGSSELTGSSKQIKKG
ncbi:hypothetical protein DM02DRAFT_653647 [Periconia macrospinosa]|uniref:Uncharacterized protein n=1 Tax=Periconia macrospinosa TaxID=97972 RepID=A0A2V1DVZ3_9PLEO|nr:hypothetical protein DM02DRAFT_653647 [Periconia macrospinosa]